MASLRNPKTWAPFMNTKDCSQGFCSLYCPQWCYIVFPPPPPFEFPDEDSGTAFSPLVIAIIGVLASAFLLVSYYAIITKYCREKSSRRETQVEEMDAVHQAPPLHESWHFTVNNGLDEALIKSIAVCQYKSGDGLVEGTECSVCLSEFEEGERLRLLPKCSHAFHIPCIDMWLKFHSNCPLCRANIVCVAHTTSQSQPHPTEAVNSPSTPSLPETQTQDENAAAGEDCERTGELEVEVAVTGGDTAPVKALAPASHLFANNTVIVERDESGSSAHPNRRSISMGYVPFSVSDALHLNQDGDVEQEYDGSCGSSAGEFGKASYGSKVFQRVLRPSAMKRSFSSGIFFGNSHARGRNSNAILPF